MAYTAASQSSSAVTYTNTATGETMTLTGGSVAWRDNNPGNITYGSVAISAGAIGKDSNGFAIFPDQTTGMAALETVVNNYANAGSTINSMMTAYAPSFENNTSAYQAFLSGQVGVAGTTKLSALTPAQKTALLNGIVKMEGTTPGTVKYFVPAAAGGGSGGTTYTAPAAPAEPDFTLVTTPALPKGTVTITVLPSANDAIDGSIPSGSSSSSGDTSGDGGSTGTGGDDGGGDDGGGDGGDGGGGSEDDFSEALKLHGQKTATAHSPIAASNKLVQAMAAFNVSAGVAQDKVAKIEEANYQLVSQHHR